MLKKLIAIAGLVLGLAMPAGAQSVLSTTTCPGAGCTITDVNGAGTVSVQITGTYVGTIQFEQSTDGVNFIELLMSPEPSGDRLVNSVTSSTGNWTAVTAGYLKVQHRFSSYTSGSATISVILTPADSSLARNLLWNSGGGWAKWRQASLSSFPTSQTFTSSNENGRGIVEKGPRWSKVSTPAVSTQASASVAAESGVRHVADSVCFSAGSTTAPALTKLTVNLRDGATGAGTIIASWTVVIPAATGQNVVPQCFNDLNLTGTTNTAMTLEFSALLTNLFQDVTLTGFNVF